MPVFEVIGGGDRRSLIKRFERKSKHDAVSELVDFHLLHCSRIETLEAEAQALREEVERGNRITCAMALDIAAVGEALGIPGEQQEGGTGEFIDIIQEMKSAQAATTASPAPCWIAAEDGLPEVKEGEERELMVCVRRARNGKSYVFAARYLNQYPLHSEWHPDADAEGMFLATGWHDVKEHSDYDGYYSPLIDTPGDEVTHWAELLPLPQGVQHE